MRIIDKLLNNYKNTNLNLKNVEDFDYTKVDENEIFNFINKYLNKTMADPEMFDKIAVKLTMVNMQDMCLKDGKIYPVMQVEFEACLYGSLQKANIYIGPFGCFKFDDEFWGNVFKKNITKAVVSYMTDKFGSKYTEKREEFIAAVKNAKLKQAKIDFKKQTKEAEDEYMENIHNM